MRNSCVVSAAVAIALGAVFAGCDEPAAPADFRGLVKDLGPAPSVLGDRWTGPTGLVIDNLADPEALAAELRAVAQELKKAFEPIGVRKVADFTFRVPDEPWRQVTLRVFVFDTPESCKSWWMKKYRYDGWEKHYKSLNVKGYEAVDSTEAPKRAAAIGNVWMTCHALKEGGDHVKVMDACIEKVRQAAKPK
jgi:hypothetical protein